MSLFKLLNFLPVPSPVSPDALKEWKTDAGIGRRRWPGMLQGGHCGSTGQGKCLRDPRAMLQG
ncbi:unnamed protein product, partial [Staurois parvus]